MLAATLSGCTASAPTPKASNDLTVGFVLPTGGMAEVQPLLDYLHSITGKKIQTTQVLDDNALLVNFERHVDIALLSTAGYVAATDAKIPLEALVAVVPAGTTSPDYASLAVIPTASPIASIAGFKGKHVCLGSEDSTAGYLYPQAALVAAGLSPGSDIVPVLPSDAQKEPDAEQVEDSIIAGRCDAGFVAAWGGASLPSGVRELSRVPVPAPVMVASTRLPVAVRQSIAQGLIQLTPAVLAETTIAPSSAFRPVFAGFAPVPTGFFGATISACAATSSPLCRYQPPPTP